jgi:hypothetical protein
MPTLEEYLDFCEEYKNDFHMDLGGRYYHTGTTDFQKAKKIAMEIFFMYDNVTEIKIVRHSEPFNDYWKIYFKGRRDL